MLTLKSQKITPNLATETSEASFALAGENYFAVFAFHSQTPFTIQVAQNIVSDVFTHQLAASETDPALQVLEQAFKQCFEALQKLRADMEVSISAGLFKDDFIYVSVYGDNKALCLDGTQLVHAATENEGHFASGVQAVEDGKVVVLCTKEFFHNYPPKSLMALAKPILAQDLSPLSSAVIIKVDKVSQAPSRLEIKEKVGKELNLAARKHLKTSLLKPVAGLILALLVIVGAYFAFKALFFKPSANTTPADSTSSAVPDTSPPPESKEQEIQDELSNKLDEANKVKRVKAEVFYDVSMADAKTNPTELAQGTNFLAVSDASQGKIYVSAKDVTKFEELPQLFPGVKNLQFDGDTLVFTDNEGVKYYTLATKSVNKSYLADPAYPVLGPASEYAGFTYSVSGDKLVKFTKTTAKLTGALWSQKEEFTSAVSMAIDGSIYVLFSNGNLEKYAGGVKADFGIVGLDKPIQKPLKVVASPDFKQLYVGDGSEGRILAFDEDGVLAFQIKPELGGEWTSLKSFDVASGERIFYVLSGTKVYDFVLPQTP